MTNTNYLRLSLQKGEFEGHVTLKLIDSDLALPFEDFCERYLRPAFEQAAREEAYAREQHVPK